MPYQTRPGDATLPSKELNKAFAAADRVLNNAVGPQIPANGLDSSIILVRNGSGQDVARYGVLGLGPPRFTHSSSPDEFAARIYMNGQNPREVASGTIDESTGHDHRHVVALEPIKSGDIGPCVAQGFVQVKVEMQETWHQYAAVIRGDVTKLTSSPVGTTKIEYVDANSGTQWAIVRLGTSFTQQTFARITGYGSGGAGSGYFEADEYITNQTGISGTGLVITGRAFNAAGMGELRAFEAGVQWRYTPGDAAPAYYPVHWHRTASNVWVPFCLPQNDKYRVMRVLLETSSGSAGDQSTRAGFIYDAKYPDGTLIESDINPNTGNQSEYRRPTVGKMVAATHGYGYFTSSSAFVLVGCNEYLDMESVQVVSDSNPSETKITIASPGASS
ncbi:MAG: hypothetical protein AAGC72_01155 [Planctomycetota bacterium]